MAPGRVVTRVARIEASGGDALTPGEPPTSPSDLLALTVPSALDDAAATFGGGSVDAIGYASTSTGYVLGSDAGGGHARTPFAAVGPPGHRYVAGSGRRVAALRVRRVALVHPPWFGDELN